MVGTEDSSNIPELVDNTSGRSEGTEDSRLELDPTETSQDLSEASVHLAGTGDRGNVTALVSIASGHLAGTDESSNAPGLVSNVSSHSAGTAEYSNVSG